MLLDSATSTIGTTVESRQISELPLNGRNPIDLLALSAGIRIQAGFGGRSVQSGTPGGTYQGFSFNGGIAGSNATLVEGLALDMAQMNAPSFVPPADATQEFRAQTNKFSAEYGRTTGAVISVSIKSGTNSFHGSLYEYFRNRSLNANNFFQNRAGNPRAPFNQNEFGGTIGGPIKRDRTFFFVNVDEYRQVAGAPGDYDRSYSLAIGRRLIRNLYRSRRPGSCCRSSHNGATAKRSYIRQVFPETSSLRIESVSRIKRSESLSIADLAGQAFTNVNNYSTRAASRVNEHQVISKIDHNLNARWKIFGTYSRDWLDQGNDDPFGFEPKLTRAVKNIRNHATVSATAVFSPSSDRRIPHRLRPAVFQQFPQRIGFDITTLGFPRAFADQAQIRSYPSFSVAGLAGIGGSGSAGQSFGGMNSWGQRACTDLGEGHAHPEVRRRLPDSADEPIPGQLAPADFQLHESDERDQSVESECRQRRSHGVLHDGICCSCFGRQKSAPGQPTSIFVSVRAG